MSARAAPIDAHANDPWRARMREKLRRELGPLRALLEERDVEEIFVNPDGHVWVDRAGAPRARAGEMPAHAVHALLCTVATTLGTAINHERPYLDGELLLDGSRVSGEIPPLASAPALRIRRHAEHVATLDALVGRAFMTKSEARALRRAIGARANLVIVGATASGKTYLANALLGEIARLTPEDRVLSIEDTAELRPSSPDALAWYTGDTVDMHRCLIRALRATPRRIVVGEVRGGEAWQLLKLWNTGHDGGLCTVHSNRGPEDGLRRLEQAAAESPEVRGMGREWIATMIAEAVDVLINIVHEGGRRHLAALARVHGRDPRRGHYLLGPLIPEEEP